MNSLLQQLCKSLQAPDTAKRYQNASMGIAFIILNQLIIVPVQVVLDLHSINIPASIPMMLLFSIFMIAANYIHGGTTQFYSKYMRGPTDFLGRHMSFGFVASFVMLNRDHISEAIDVPRIAGAFIITTLVGYVGSFLVASGCFKIEYRLRGRRTKTPDIENINRSWPSPSTDWPAPPTEKSPKVLSQLSQINVALVQNGSLISIKPANRSSASQVIVCLVRTAPLCLCIFLIATVGVPVYCKTGYEAPFEALCFVLFWLLAVQFQRSLKVSCRLLQFHRLRSALIIFANPVLVTWALGTAYLWIKTTLTKADINTVVTQFKRHNTFAESIIAIGKGDSLTSHIGAGDLAGPILDAGIVCLGFKMFEYRKELWESLITVLTTCATLAVTSVFFNVLIARALGLQAEDALAYAARSVTIALGVPVIQNLDGSTTLMSAMVIFGGIVFQMAGDWLFSLLRINDRECQQKIDYGSGSDTEKTSIMVSWPDKEPQSTAGAESAVIAAGVTVGINAAAMGTAHLIERDSRATAYSALSMTVFGAMTVALTALPGVSRAVILLASR
ncbi:hypothetical protein GGR54DRAFT_330860 [Hypoxylon sp. NC1633]|nr:hypothetical protein GGR54DRAFT_330860 [Hypoxylon sp. NC1633]